MRLSALLRLARRLLPLKIKIKSAIESCQARVCCGDHVLKDLSRYERSTPAMTIGVSCARDGQRRPQWSSYSMSSRDTQPPWWAVAFRSHSTESCLQLLQQRLPGDTARVLHPTRLLLEYHRGSFQLRRRSLYPGYAFVACPRALLQQVMHDKPRAMYGVVSPGDALTPVQPHEMDALLTLLDDTGTVGFSHGELRDGRIRIISGPLHGKEGMILKLSKRRHRATIGVSIGNKHIRLDLTCITHCNATPPTHAQ